MRLRIYEHDAVDMSKPLQRNNTGMLKKRNVTGGLWEMGRLCPPLISSLHELS